MKILYDIFEIIEERKKNPSKESYTSSLFSKGEDKILEKVGEEAVELILASKKGEKELIIHEASDLLFHILVALSCENISLKEVEEELDRRRKKK